MSYEVNDLAEFLLTRIAEDEEVLTRSEAYQHHSHGYDAPGTYSPTCPTCRQMVWGTRQRALAECEAKRRIVELATVDDVSPGWDRLDQILGNLALPYVAHPDYRDEWRP